MPFINLISYNIFHSAGETNQLEIIQNWDSIHFIETPKPQFHLFVSGATTTHSTPTTSAATTLPTGTIATTASTTEGNKQQQQVSCFKDKNIAQMILSGLLLIRPLYPFRMVPATLEYTSSRMLPLSQRENQLAQCKANLWGLGCKPSQDWDKGGEWGALRWSPPPQRNRQSPLDWT